MGISKVVSVGMLLACAVLSAGCGGASGQLSAVNMSGAMPGQKGRLRVTLANPANGAQKVSLTWGGVALNSPPSSITIPSGQTSADIPFTAGSAVGGATVTAKLGNDSAQATGDVVKSFAVSYFSVHTVDDYEGSELAVGATATMVVQLNAVPPTDTTVSMTATPAGMINLPASVVVPAFQSQALFTATGVSKGYLNIDGKVGDASYSTRFEVYDNSDYFYVYTSASPGQMVELEVGTAVGNQDTVVPCASSNPAVLAVPSSLTIPAGQSYIYVYLPALVPGFTTVSCVLHGSTYANVVRVGSSTSYYNFGLNYSGSTIEVGFIGTMYAEYQGSAAAPATTLNVTASSVGVAEFAAATPWPAGLDELIVPFVAKNPGSTTFYLTVPGEGAYSVGPITVIASSAVSYLGINNPKVGVGNFLSVQTSAYVAKDTPVTLTQSGAGHFTFTGSGIVGTGSNSTSFNASPDTAGSVTVTATMNGQDYSQTFTIAPAI